VAFRSTKQRVSDGDLVAQVGLISLLPSSIHLCLLSVSSDHLFSRSWRFLSLCVYASLSGTQTMFPNLMRRQVAFDVRVCIFFSWNRLHVLYVARILSPFAACLEFSSALKWLETNRVLSRLD
jgi:hypothetical protein